MSISQMSFIERLGYIFQTYGSSFLQGAGYTLGLALIGTFLGCIIGFIIGIIQTIPITNRDNIVKRVFLNIVRFFLTAYVEIFRGTPMIVQAMFIYYGSALFLGKTMPVFSAAILILSINTGAYMAETVRGGILSIDAGQTEGCKAIGMTHVQAMIHVILPQALRNIMPQIGNNFIINVKDSSVFFVIGVTELFSRGKSVAGAIYLYFETFTIIMAVYFIMTFICSRLLRFWESKMDGSDSYDLATTDTLAHTSGLYTYNENKDGEGELK